MTTSYRLIGLAICLWFSPMLWPRDIVKQCDTTAREGRVSSTVILLIVDRTAPRDSWLNASIASSVANAIRPSSRWVVWVFGGSQPMPRVTADSRMPSLEDGQGNLNVDTVVARMFEVSGHAEKVHECTLRQFISARDSFVDSLRKELDVFDDSVAGMSPIVLAISQAVAPFSREAVDGRVGVVVITDGAEHTPGTSFYLKGNGKQYPTPAQAVNLTRQIPGSWKGGRFFFYGLGFSRNSDLTGAVTLPGIWRAVVTERGGIPKEMSTGAPQRLRELLFP